MCKLEENYNNVIPWLAFLWYMICLICNLLYVYVIYKVLMKNNTWNTNVQYTIHESDMKEKMSSQFYIPFLVMVYIVSSWMIKLTRQVIKKCFLFYKMGFMCMPLHILYGIDSDTQHKYRTIYNCLAGTKYFLVISFCCTLCSISP